MHRHALLVLLLATLTLRPPSARGDERPTVVEGEVRFAGTGRLVPGATLLFYGRDDAGWSVVTDGEGRFRWTLPGQQVVSAGPEGQPGPACNVMIQDSGQWSWALVSADAAWRPADRARRDGFEALRKSATSRWQVTDRGPRLIVECPAAGDVEVVVRGPDGALAIDRPVRVYPTESPLEFLGNASVEFRGRTDAAGAFHIRWFEGIRRLRVLMPEVGFGATGSFEVLAGRMAQADLPPLARFAQIEGTVDPKLAQPGTMVERLPDPTISRVWERGQAPVDAQGRFVLRDVLPGTFRLELGRPDHRDHLSRMNNVRVLVRAEPGETIRDLRFRPPSPPQGPPASAIALPQAPPRFAGGGAGKGKEEVVWVEGTARDQAGRVVAGANVVLRTSYHGGVRMYERIEETTTDLEGHYRIRGPLLESMTPLIVVVHAEGRLPVVAYAAAPSAARSERGPLDVTLPDEGASGSLHICILKEGKPLPGANVALISDGVMELSMWAAEASRSSPACTALQAVFYPRATTGPDGMAHFANIFPGLYTVRATTGEPGVVPGIPRPSRISERDTGIAQGVGVAAGQEVNLAIALHPPALTVPLQVLRPNGSPVADQNVSLSIGLRNPYGTTSLQLDARGIGSYTFDSPGLWAIDLRFRDSKLTSFPLTAEPFDQAEALLPVSPGFVMTDPIRLKGAHRERGSLRVELRDVDGKPARGSVMTVVGFGFEQHAEQAASTDALGVARFADLPHGRYVLHGSIDGLAPPFLPQPGTMPDDLAMRDQLAFVDQTIEVKTGVETHVVLQPKRVGYVRGTVRTPAGRRPNEYFAGGIHDPQALAAGKFWDAKTGEFVTGPFIAGSLELRMSRLLESGQSQEVGIETVEVPAGSVARVELRPHEEPAPATAPGEAGQVFLGMGGLSFLNEVPRGAGGTAWLADGKTPAFGARGILLAPGQPRPVASAVSDAAGDLTWRGRWISSQARSRDGAPAPKPRAVVWLPGRTGAAVVELEAGKPFRAVLPVPLDARGAVTLGGRPSAGVNARLRIVAAHEGAGDLDVALSPSTTADADGHFVFRGLTPGRYKVQAARDGIWLSQSVELTVEPAQPPAELALDIPEPGAPLVVEIVNRKGRPVPQLPLTLMRPDGPLATLWPTDFHTDGAGQLTLRGLEAGAQSIRLDGDPTPRHFQVPEARGQAREPEVVRFVFEETP